MPLLIYYDELYMLHPLTVRGITCISYKIYHLKKLKLRLFNNDFEARLSKVTYLRYI